MGGGAGAGGGMSAFARKMMEKMNWKEGQGLGKEGEGIVNPIEVKLRPQGAGVGAVKERTEQYKQEQKRAAERRGEEYEDSSEEERNARRERKKKSQGGLAPGSGTSTPGGTRKQKTKYKTVADVRAAAPGLDVPLQMLSSIVDATGSQTKMLASAAGLMTPTGLPADSEADKIAKRERLELEAFIEAWHGVQEQKVYIEEQAGRHQLEVDQEKEDVERLQSVVEAVENLRFTTAGVSGEGAESAWTLLIAALERLQTEHKHDIEHYGLSEAAIGALSPIFKKQIADWEPLQDPELLTADLLRIRCLLGLETKDEVVTARGRAELDEGYGRSKRQKATTAYETMMYTIWLPKLRTTITNWDVLDHAPLTTLVHAWRPLLPPFVYSGLIDKLVVDKLKAALHVWDPRKRSHHHKHATVKHSEPHTWVFPWLPFLPPYQLDPKASSGLLVDIKRRLREVLDGWDVASGVLPGVLEWRALLHSELDYVCVRHLLPKLARHLSQNFEVDPSDQDLTPLENVLKWQQHLKPEILARLLVAEFFPKWLTTLHQWLSSDEANFEEVGQWFTWWKQQIPDTLNANTDIAKEWEKGTEMINNALDLQDEGVPMSQLAAPAAGPARPIAKEVSKKLDAQISAAQHPPLPGELAQDFKDIVEAWCAEQDLTLVPLREAHTQTGAPLFRITASANGKGGVVVYLKGDIVWAQKKGDRTAYEPVGLEDRLVERAEGK
jgi:tuftelin-interacting protein 11